MTDKIKQAIAALVTLALLVFPGASEVIAAAGGQPEIIAAVIAVYTVVHGVVEYIHTKATA